MNQARYGNSTGGGRRLELPAAELPISKAYDSEHRRQRRLGMYEAGLGIAGGAAALKGGKGIRNTTKDSRKAAKLVAHWKDKGTHRALSRGIVASRGDAALTAGGVTALGGAAAVRQYAEGRRGRAWN